MIILYIVISILCSLVFFALGMFVGYSEEHKFNDSLLSFYRGYVNCALDIENNLIMNGRTEVIDGQIQIVATEKRIKTTTKEMIKDKQKYIDAYDDLQFKRLYGE